MGQDAVGWEDGEAVAGDGEQQGLATAVRGAGQEADGRTVLGWMGARGEPGRACRRGPPSSEALGNSFVGGRERIRDARCMYAEFGPRCDWGDVAGKFCRLGRSPVSATSRLRYPKYMYDQPGVPNNRLPNPSPSSAQR